MMGVEGSGDGVERSRPVGTALIVHQALREFGVPEPCEAVVCALEVVLALAQQLTSKPLAPVDTDLNVEGEPSLDAGVHEAEAWIEPVVVEMKTLAGMESESAFFAVC